MGEIKSDQNVLLTEEDANIYRAFRENRDKFLILHKAGVFDCESGKVQINVNNGQFQTVSIMKIGYAREK